MRATFIVSIGLLLLQCGSAAAQSRNAFHEVEAADDLVVTHIGNSYSVTVGPAPTVTVDGIEYPINSVFGFWCLADNSDFTSPSGDDVGVWEFHRNAASNGDIAGWKTNPNLGLEAGEAMTFTFTTFKDDERDAYGFHIRVDGTVPGLGGTFYLTGPSFSPRCVADHNNDGGIDGADVEAFFLDWENGLPAADVNGDGGVDGADVEFFAIPWKAGGCF